jgi:hypothetical protein
MTNLSWDDLVKDAGDVGSFEPLPESDYDLEIKDAKFKPTKTGKKMYEITCKVVGGAHNGRQVWDNLVVSPDSPNALAFFFRKMAALGLTVDYFKTNPSDEAIVAALRGRRFRGHVGFRTYNGEKRNELQKYYPATGGGVPEMPGAGAPPAPAAAPPAPAAPPVAAAPPAPAPAPAPAAAPAPAVDPWTGQAPAAAPAAAPAPPAPAPEAAAPPPPPAPAPAPAPAAPAPEQAAAPADQGVPAPPPPPQSPF